MTDLQNAISTSQRKRFLKIAFLLLLSIIGIPLLIYAVNTIYNIHPYRKIMRLLQFHPMFQICCSKNGRRKESSPHCLPVVVDQQKSLIDVRFASPLHIHTYLSLCGFQSLAPISLSSSSSSTSSSSSCSLTWEQPGYWSFVTHIVRWQWRPIISEITDIASSSSSLAWESPWRLWRA